MDALTRHRMLQLAGIPTAIMRVPARVETRDADDELEEEPLDEVDFDGEELDDEEESEEDDAARSAALIRHRTLGLLGILESRTATPYNPAPGRQVITHEGAKKYQVPIGSTILPGGKVLLPNGKTVTKPTAKKYYLAGGGEPGKAAPVKKAAAPSAPKKAAPHAPKAPAKKAPGKKAAPATAPVMSPQELDDDIKGMNAAQLRQALTNEFGEHEGTDYPNGMTEAELATRLQGKRNIQKALKAQPIHANNASDIPGVTLDHKKGFFGNAPDMYLVTYNGAEIGQVHGDDSHPGMEWMGFPAAGAHDQGGVSGATKAEAIKALVDKHNGAVAPSGDLATNVPGVTLKSGPAGKLEVTHLGAHAGYIAETTNGEWVVTADALGTGDVEGQKFATKDQAIAALVGIGSAPKPNFVLGVEDAIGVTPIYDTSSGSPVQVATLEPHPSGKPGGVPVVKKDGIVIGSISDNTSHNIGAGFNTHGAGGDHLGLFKTQGEAIAAILGNPKAASIYKDLGTLPKGAKKVAPTVQAAAKTSETISELKVPAKAGLSKSAFEIYVGTTKFGNVEQSVGSWTATNPAGGNVGYYSSKAKAVAALVSHKATVAAKAVQQAQAALGAQQKAAAQAARDAQKAADRAKVDVDLARLRGRSPNPTPDEARVYAGDFSHLTRVGAQAGSNEGGVFEAPDGSRWYVKAQQSPQHAANEALAADLYRAAGIDAPEVYAGSGTPGLGGGSHTATRILDTVKSDLKDRIKGAEKGNAADAAFVRDAHRGFAVDAWLANWDAAGQNFDNIVSLDRKPVRIDSGGALLYRAQGEPKGDTFGPIVTEWDSFTDPNSTRPIAALHDTITRNEMLASAARVEKITPERIQQMVADRGLPSSLADTLIARREDILSRAAAVKATPPKPFAEGALTSQKALNAVAVDKDHAVAQLTSFGVSDEEAAAAAASLSGYKGSGYKAINKYLWGRGPGSDTYNGKTAEQHVADMDTAFAHSGLNTDIVVYQGSRDPGRMFPPGQWKPTGGMEGLEFTVPAFWSSSVSKAQAEAFSDWTGGNTGPTAQQTVMRIVVPKGTAVVALDTSTGGEAEVLLNRGLRYRIVADHGFKDGIRRFDVEVIGRAETLADLDQSQLVALLSKNGLPTTGDKGTLLARLHNAGIQLPDTPGTLGGEPRMREPGGEARGRDDVRPVGRPGGERLGSPADGQGDHREQRRSVGEAPARPAAGRLPVQQGPTPADRQRPLAPTSQRPAGNDAAGLSHTPTPAQRSRMLALLSVEARATAHTVQSINAHPIDTERLRLYWTKNPEGLAKWATKPHPWTALREHLAKYIHNPGELDRTTSAWHFEVFHMHTGSDLYRVEHGGKPRGHRVGPG